MRGDFSQKSYYRYEEQEPYSKQFKKGKITMYYVGVDLHKETSWFYIVDSHGEKVDSKDIVNEPAILKRYFEQIPKPFILAVEATYNWYFFVDLAEQYAQKVFLANSFELKAFAKRHKKQTNSMPD